MKGPDTLRGGERAQDTPLPTPTERGQSKPLPEGERREEKKRQEGEREHKETETIMKKMNSEDE